MNNEIWKKSLMPGSEKLLVSNMGRIKFPCGRITTGCRKYNISTKSCYCIVKTNRRYFKVHRIVCFTFHKDTWRIWLKHVDHINHNTEDNRESNLRFTTNQLNQYNRRNTTGYSVRPSGNFEAHVRYSGKKLSKTFKTSQEAEDWSLAKKAECVELALQLLRYKDAWFQNMKKVHSELCDGLRVK